MLPSWLSSATFATLIVLPPCGSLLGLVFVTRMKLPPLKFVIGSSSPVVRSAGPYAGISYSHNSMFASPVNGFGGGVGVGVGVPVGVAVGDGVGVGEADGVGVGIGVAVGVGVGEVNAFPLKLPGLVPSGAEGVDVVAFELNTIHRPFVLIIGRLFAIKTRTFPKALGRLVL